MTDNERIIALLEDIKYELQQANYQRAGGRGIKPAHDRNTEDVERLKGQLLQRSQSRVIANIRAAEAS